MNFLAHLHLASLAQSSLLGNFVADFVRGDPYLVYSKEIADGIMLHRRIDVIVDGLSPIKQATSLFASQRQRLASIALDIVWDHFLARHWNQITNQQTLAEFSYWLENQIVPYLEQMPENFQYMNQFLWQERWFERYAKLDFIAEVLNKMALRRPKLHLLAECILDINVHYHQLDAIFGQFYPRMMERAVKKEL